MSLEQELVKQINSLQKQVDGLIKPEVNIDIISPFLALPGLVGFWSMSSVQRSTGNVYDLSGQSRTLTYNGNPTFNYTGLVPYIDLDGTGDYLSRADETDLDILGSETIYNSAVRGLSMGGWFWFDQAPGTGVTLMSKFTAAPALSYDLDRIAAGNIYASISGDGTFVNSKFITSSVIPATATWVFCALTYFPSTSLNIFVNSVKTSNTTGIPAAIYNSNAPFQIGGYNGANQLPDGRASLCFLCANALSDSIISALFSRTRAAFLI